MFFDFIENVLETVRGNKPSNIYVKWFTGG